MAWPSSCTPWGAAPRAGRGPRSPRGSRWLYASAHPQRARLHLVSARPPRPADEVTPLLLLLRKYVDGGRLDAVSQPELERIARLDFSRRAPTGEVWQTTLVVEVLGRQSNLVLLDTDGTVMDAARRVRAAAEPQPDGAAPAALHPSDRPRIASTPAGWSRLSWPRSRPTMPPGRGCGSCW